LKPKQKLLTLLEALKTEYLLITEFLKEHNVNQPPKIRRWRLRGLIANTLNLTERHSIYLWIERLLAMNVLELNPTSSFNNGEYAPDNNTRYVLNIEAINTEIAKNRPTTPTRLTQF